MRSYIGINLGTFERYVSCRSGHINVLTVRLRTEMTCPEFTQLLVSSPSENPFKQGEWYSSPPSLCMRSDEVH
jgi:hypothetical protein